MRWLRLCRRNAQCDTWYLAATVVVGTRLTRATSMMCRRSCRQIEHTFVPPALPVRYQQHITRDLCRLTTLHFGAIPKLPRSGYHEQGADGAGRDRVEEMSHEQQRVHAAS